MPDERKFRTVNRSLGKKPSIGPIPTDQFFPWIGILIVSVLIFYYILGAGWLATSMAFGWGCSTWWIVSSNKNFISKFIGVPRISRGYMRFLPLTQQEKRGSDEKNL
jgi:hypothetical protein